MSARGRFFVISGPSGAGKSTVGRLVRKRLGDLAYSVSLTSRAPRPGERDGVDYHFVSREEFKRRIDAGEMAEWAEVFGNLYGTSRKVLNDTLEEGRDLLLEIDVEGAAQLQKRFPEGVYIFILPPSGEELERRLRGRGTEDEATVRRRLARVQAEMGRAGTYDHQVVNRDLDAAVDEVAGIIQAARNESAG